MTDHRIAQNVVDRAKPELDDFLARFYHQIGVYAVASALGQSVDEAAAEPAEQAPAAIDRAA
ncbi:MAG: hypothetical protein IPL88_16160 [Rhizobiales bacterium]|nr:hypothetical protein [Hyphomicrobiales bacterium]